jgi:hypothetical protein
MPRDEFSSPIFVEGVTTNDELPEVLNSKDKLRARLVVPSVLDAV